MRSLVLMHTSPGHGVARFPSGFRHPYQKSRYRAETPIKKQILVSAPNTKSIFSYSFSYGSSGLFRRLAKPGQNGFKNTESKRNTLDSQFKAGYCQHRMSTAANRHQASWRSRGTGIRVTPFLCRRRFAIVTRQLPPRLAVQWYKQDCTSDCLLRAHYIASHLLQTAVATT